MEDSLLAIKSFMPTTQVSVHFRSMLLRFLIAILTRHGRIEWCFKELKSTLGMNQCSFKDFAAVESWMGVVLITFYYREHQRLQRQLKNNHGLRTLRKRYPELLFQEYRCSA
ncbi:hypothetical protein [Rosistilla carotiformis]|nr:hypothetical protein [Rosistilla carotiformis]